MNGIPLSGQKMRAKGTRAPAYSVSSFGRDDPRARGNAQFLEVWLKHRMSAPSCARQVRPDRRSSGAVRFDLGAPP